MIQETAAANATKVSVLIEKTSESVTIQLQKRYSNNSIHKNLVVDNKQERPATLSIIKLLSLYKDQSHESIRI